jgi:hypothetical protein
MVEGYRNVLQNYSFPFNRQLVLTALKTEEGYLLRHGNIKFAEEAHGLRSVSITLNYDVATSRWLSITRRMTQASEWLKVIAMCCRTTHFRFLLRHGNIKFAEEAHGLRSVSITLNYDGRELAQTIN